MDTPIIIVIYAGVEHIDSAYVPQYLESMSSAMHTMYGDVGKTIIIPDRFSNETRVECINPQLVTPEKYKEAEAAVDKLKEAVDKILAENKEE